MKQWIQKLSYSRPFAWLVHWPSLLVGVLVFRLTGRTPWLSYWSMRRLYCVTRGRSNRWLARQLGQSPTAGAGGSARGALSDLGEGDRHAIVEAIHRDGFHVLGRRLPDADVESLVAFARSTPAGLKPAPAGGPLEARFDPERPLAVSTTSRSSC